MPAVVCPTVIPFLLLQNTCLAEPVVLLDIVNIAPIFGADVLETSAWPDTVRAGPADEFTGHCSKNADKIG